MKTENVKKPKSLQEAAERAKELFEYHPKTDKEPEFYSFKLDAVMEKSELFELLSEKINGLSMDETSLFEFVDDALDHIADLDPDEDLDEAVDEWVDSDTDVYTSDLTAFLNRSDYNVDYLTQALEEFGEHDGFRVLQQAQLLARKEVCEVVIDALKEYINDDDDDTDDDDDY